MPKFELNKISFINPDDLTETVTVTTIQEGSEGATRAYVEDSAESYTIKDNQVIEDTLNYALTALGKKTDNTDQAQLYTWANNQTPLTIVGYAYNNFMQVENVYLKFRAKGSERLTWGFTASKTGGTGFDADGKLETEFMLSPNGLNMYNWQESSTANLPAGWTKTGGTTNWDDSNNEIDFSTSGATVLYMYRDLYVPELIGKTLTAFITVDAVTSTTGLYIGIVCYDESDSTVGSESTTAISATGTSSVSRVIPATTNYIRVRVKIAQDDAISFSNPGLSIGTSTTYIPR
jgi:hypothetical protein